MIRIRALVAVLAIAVPVPVVVAGCGGGGGGGDSSADPQQVLDQSTITGVRSGHLNISFNGTTEGTQSGSASLSLDGPFQTGATGTIPQFDLTGKVDASGAGQSFNFEGSLVATKDNAFVVYQDQAYEVGTAGFQQLTNFLQKAQQQSGQQNTASLSQFFKKYGIDPKTWLTNVNNEGTTDVEGTSTVHVHGDADVAKMVSDLQSASSKIPNAPTQQLTPGQIDQLRQSIKTATVDVYSGESDHIIRKADVTLEVAPPASASSSSGVSSAKLTFSFTLSDVNQPQTIAAPSNPQPIAQLLNQIKSSPLGGLLGSGSTSIPNTGGTSGSVGGGGGPSDAYTKCIQNSAPQDIGQCAKFLQ